MKKLLLLSALLIFACSSDDSSDDSNQLFLEKYDSVVWLGGDIDYTNKMAFINSSKALTIYSIDEEACFSYELEGTTETPDNEYERVIGQIEEETENSITIFFQFVGGPDPFNQLITYTITYDGSTYTLKESIAENAGTYTTYIRTDDEVCF
tara:strand:+ start:689 stop:1144 length:456 start_codon:yes stop_codon:yes gene_type:complete